MIFHFYFITENRIAPDVTPCLATHIWVYSVCLCPIKRTPGLYGLISNASPNLSITNRRVQFDMTRDS